MAAELLHHVNSWARVAEDCTLGVMVAMAMTRRTRPPARGERFGGNAPPRSPMRGANRPTAALTRRQGPTTGPRCASCQTGDDLVVGNDTDEVVFCRDCATPISSLDFPEYYCDLGGGD